MSEAKVGPTACADRCPGVLTGKGWQGPWRPGVRRERLQQATTPGGQRMGRCSLGHQGGGTGQWGGAGLGLAGHWRGVTFTVAGMAVVAGLHRREMAGVISAYAGESRLRGGLGLLTVMMSG